MRGSGIAVFLLSAGAFCACAGLGSREPAAIWREIEVSAPSETVLFKLTLLAVEGQGYPVAGGTDRGAGTIASGWRTSLQPFQGAGVRLRAVVEIAPSGERRFKVRARVQQQTNEALVAPLDPTRAEWKWAEDDPIRAQVLLQHVRSALEGTTGG